MLMRKRENLVLLFDNCKEDEEEICSFTQTIASKLNCPIPSVSFECAPSYLTKFKLLGLPGADNELENKIEFIVNDLRDLRVKNRRPRMFVLPNYTWFGENTAHVFKAYSLLASNSYFADTDICSFIGYYGNLIDISSLDACLHRFALYEKPGITEYFSHLPRLYYLMFGENRQVLELIKTIGYKKY